MTSFTIYRDSLKSYRVIVKSNEEILFTSISHDSRVECFNTIKLIKKLVAYKKAYQIERLECGSWSFSLLDLTNSKIVGVSQNYITKEILESKISYFSENLKYANLDFNTYSF